MGDNCDHLHHVPLYDNRMEMKYRQSYEQTALGDCHFDLIRKSTSSVFETDKKQPGLAFEP